MRENWLVEHHRRQAAEGGDNTAFHERAAAYVQELIDARRHAISNLPVAIADKRAVRAVNAWRILGDGTRDIICHQLTSDYGTRPTAGRALDWLGRGDVLDVLTLLPVLLAMRPPALIHRRAGDMVRQKLWALVPPAWRALVAPAVREPGECDHDFRASSKCCVKCGWTP